MLFNNYDNYDECLLLNDFDDKITIKNIKKKRVFDEEEYNKKLIKKLFCYDYDKIIKDNNGYYELNDYNTLKYILDINYRKFIKETTELDKLILNISNMKDLYHIEDKSIFNVYKINIYNCDNLIYIGDLDNLIQLNIKSCNNLIYISNLENLKNLIINDCNN